MKIQTVICDIEGTTSSISFVHRVLFPLALEKLHSYLVDNTTNAELQQVLTRMWQQLYPQRPAGADLLPVLEEKLAEYIRTDVKDTTLKWVQGKIWKAAFESGSVKGHMYPEVSKCFRCWHEAGRKLYIYSSGSIEAQQLMFRHSEAGDLTGYLSGYFDTTTGPKREAGSYTAIAQALGVGPDSALFLSDITAELQAAEVAGMQTCLLLREGAAADLSYGGKTANTFEDVDRIFFQ